MRFKTMATITAVIFTVVGLGFLFPQMNWLRFFGPGMRLSRQLMTSSESRQVYLMMYSSLYSFIYVLGAALCGCGLLAWALRNLKSAAEQANATLALFGLNIVVGLTALAQQIDFWRVWAGWIIVAAFLAQAVGYGWLLLMKPKVAAPLLTVAADPSAQDLRAEWTRQIQEAAAQAERNRLARELHDAIKQQLFSINVNAATVQARWDNDENGARSALEAVRDSVREAMAEMEAMLHNLRPAPLETMGLAAALRQQCEALEYRTGAHVTAEIGTLPAQQEWPAGAQDAVFRIAQEALTNIARHARANQVRVRLYQQPSGDEDAVWLKIEDNGSGFDTAHAGGMGLANIRARALEAGGELQIASRTGEGTSLTLRVPLLANGNNEVRRELRVALVFTLVGFVAAGSWLLGHSGAYWPLAGLSVFALAGLSCYRAARSIQQMQIAGVAPPKQMLELRSQLRQVIALLLFALLWSLENWHIAAEIWHVYIPNETLLLTAWPVLTGYAAYRVHQLLRLQTRALTEAEFLVSLARWWQRVSVFLAVAILFLLARPGILAYPLLKMILILQGLGPRLAPLNFQPLRAFWMATLALFLYWLYLTAWRLRLQRRAARSTPRRERKL